MTRDELTRAVLPPRPDPDAMREAERILDQLADLSRYRIEASAVSPSGVASIQLRDIRPGNPLQVFGIARPGRWTTLPLAKVRALYGLN